MSCGKSSLSGQGFFPRWVTRFSKFMWKQLPDNTEATLCTRLRNQLPDLPTHLSLAEILNTVRLQGSTTSSDKLLLVLDQFEQWLAAKGGEDDSELLTGFSGNATAKPVRPW